MAKLTVQYHRRCDAFIPDVIFKVPNVVLVGHENLPHASGRAHHSGVAHRDNAGTLGEVSDSDVVGMCPMFSNVC